MIDEYAAFATRYPYLLAIVRNDLGALKKALGDAGADAINAPVKRWYDTTPIGWALHLNCTELILELLAKDPDARPRRAADVAARLQAIYETAR